MFGLADVNSFYASCEKVFRPDLKGCPVVVLSNNDGCCIAQSPEAKRMGIKMGDPWFKIREQTFTEKIHVFSSNYELYASMSNRVMSCLEEMAPRVEQYSIDEMFLDLRGLETVISYETFGAQLRAHVQACTRLTIGVGMGLTKTLIKSAQWASKEWPAFRGALALTPGTPPPDGKTARPAACPGALGRRQPYRAYPEHNGDHHDPAAGPRIPGLHPEKFQCGARTLRAGTQRRILYSA